MEKRLHFIKANMEYVDVVFRWANDKETRANAFNTAQIPYDDHVTWYRKKISEAETFFYICKYEDTNVGQLRIDLEEDKAVISYSVDKTQRGKGYGKRLINYAEEVIRDNCLFGYEQIILVGKVKYNNIASQKCFLAENYNKKEREDYIEFTKVITKEINL